MQAKALRIITIISLSFLFFNCKSTEKRPSVNSKLASQDQQLKKCTPTREYVTTINYLRDNKFLKLGENAIRSIAAKVSTGCSGAAIRFIRVMNVLLTAKLDSRNSVRIAKEFALSTDPQTEAFIMVFKYSYLHKYLDLDLLAALNIARKFSLEFNGDHILAEKNFTGMVKYCVSAKNLALPNLKCAILASDITLCGQNFTESIFNSYKILYNFLISNESKHPNLTPADARKITKELVCISPNAESNFIDAYKFAVSESGQKLSRSKAVIFAKKLASQTSKEQKKTKN